MTKDVKYPLILCAALIVIIGLNYFCFGNFLYDCGREFLVPDLINQGLTPIKDIFLTYFPLSYQINALLFKIFTSSLDVLRVAGVISSLIATVFIYFCAREFTSPEKSLIVTFITTSITMINVSYLYNSVMGYSYAFIYGAAIFFVSLFFILKFLFEDKFLYPAFFVLGLCFALKAEFVFIIIPYVLLLIYKKVSLKKVFIALFLYILPFILSFLFLKFNFSDFTRYISFLSDFLKSDVLKIYNEHVFITNPIKWLEVNFMSFLNFAVMLFISYLFLFLPHKFKKPSIYKICSFILFVLFFIYTLFLGEFSAGNLFSYLCITTLFILIYSMKKKNIPFIFLALVQLALAFRFNFIYSGGFLAYIMPVALFLNILFFTNTKSETFNKILTTFLILISCLNIFYFTLAQKINCIYKIETKKGTIYVAEKGLDKVINDTLSFMNEIEDDKTVLILPEGHMFNYLTNKKTNPLYYQLIPNHIEVLGEENIINGLNKNKPDYVIFATTDYTAYGAPIFGRDFGLKIAGFVYKNYEYVKTFSNPHTKFQFSAFKLKTL